MVHRIKAGENDPRKEETTLSIQLKRRKMGELRQNRTLGIVEFLRIGMSDSFLGVKSDEGHESR